MVKKKRGKSLEQHWPLTMTGYLKVHPKITYRKVASSNTSCLEAHAGFFRLLMKWIFDPNVL